MMRNAGLFLVAILGTLMANAVEYQCTKCQTKVLENDKFCPNCGIRFVEPSSHPPSSSSQPTPEPDQPSEIQIPKAERSEYWHAVENHTPGHALPVPAGMLRGMAEIACSPLELVRLASILECSIIDGAKRDGNPLSAVFFTIVGVPTGVAVMGPITVSLDAVMGALDVVSLGTLGNAVWDNDRKSPYVFERSWTLDSYISGVWM